MLANISLENFEMQDGFTIEGNSKNGKLLIIRKEKRTTAADKKGMKTVAADEIAEKIIVTPNELIKNSDTGNMAIERSSIISIYYKNHFIKRDVLGQGRPYQIREKNYSIYIDYVDANGKINTFALLDQILSKYMSRYIIQEINALLGITADESAEAMSETCEPSVQDNMCEFLGLENSIKEKLIVPLVKQSKPSASSYKLTTHESNSQEHFTRMLKKVVRRWFSYLALPFILWPLVGDYILSVMHLSEYQMKYFEEGVLYACIILLGLICYNYFQEKNKIFKYCGFEFNADGAVIYEKNLKGDKKLLFNGNVSDIIRVIPYEIKKKPFGVESLADNSRKKNNLLDMLHLTSEEDNEYQKYEKNFFTVVVELTNGNRIMVLPEEPTSFQQAEYIALSVNKHLTSM